MIIRFSRPRGAAVLTCIRDDGTVVWNRPRQGEFFAAHDLMHYAVESSLHLTQSFFGLIAAGWTLEDFSRPGARLRLPAEAIYTEFVVGLLLQEQAFGSPSEPDAFHAGLSSSMASKGLPVPRVISAVELAAIREQFDRLHHAYRALPPGGSLDLAFGACS